jgi:hypothetical protein
MIPYPRFVRFIASIFIANLLIVLVIPLTLRGGDNVNSIRWMTDYAKARESAEKQNRMLLIFFRDAQADASVKRFETETLGDAKIREKLQDYICVQLPMDAKITIDDKEVLLLEHSTFSEMLGRPGVAIVDYQHSEPEYRSNVVSIFPLTDHLAYPPEKMAVILDLPRGSLTQRTLIYAVLTHPERPLSTSSEPDAYLLEEAKQQAEYQAQSGRQGHQNWEYRFQRIAGRVRGGAPREICAESWPGQNIVEAAMECVHSWRTSSGHWSAIRTRPRYFAFDMKRSRNGIWYATGIVSM